MFKAFVSFFAGMDWLTILTFVLTNACLVLWIFFRKQKYLPFVSIFGILLTVLFRLKAGYSNGNEPLLFSMWAVVIVVLFYITANFTVKTVYEYKRNKKSKVGYIHKQEIKLNDKGTPDFSEFLGKFGFCKTDLRPSGKVDFGDKTMDCVANKGYIYAGNRVKVVKIDGSKIVVAKRN